MEGLKEWATVVKALEQGKQTVILRKGGILETASGFNIESKKFFLFPTWEHQETKHVKPEFHNFLNQVLNKKPDEGFNRITSFAEVLDEKPEEDIEAQEEPISGTQYWKLQQYIMRYNISVNEWYQVVIAEEVILYDEENVEVDFHEDEVD